jgi:hypothetical protein
VVNIFKKLLELSVIDKEDRSILDSIKTFAAQAMREVAPAQQLIRFVDRIVST